METWWEDRRQGGGSGGGESTAEQLSVVGSLTEVREEEQQSLARIEKAGEREILRVPARHMVSSQVTAQHIHALMETWVQTVLSCCTRKKIYTLNKKQLKNYQNNQFLDFFFFFVLQPTSNWQHHYKRKKIRPMLNYVAIPRLKDRFVFFPH